MEELLERSEDYAYKVSENISDRENDARSMCFWNIHNRIKITEEILNFYEMSWSAARIDVNDPDVGNELVERIVTVTKNLFADIVSMVEKTSKEAVDIYKDTGIRRKALDNRNFLYLRNIVQATCDLGLISKKEFEEWDDVLIMRNLVTHNNSVSDRSKKFMVSGITISMRPGRMMKGPVNTFVILSEKMITLFYDWLVSVDGYSKKSE